MIQSCQILNCSTESKIKTFRRRRFLSGSLDTRKNWNKNLRRIPLLRHWGHDFKIILPWLVKNQEPSRFIFLKTLLKVHFISSSKETLQMAPGWEKFRSFSTVKTLRFWSKKLCKKFNRKVSSNTVLLWMNCQAYWTTALG